MAEPDIINLEEEDGQKEMEVENTPEESSSQNPGPSKWKKRSKIYEYFDLEKNGKKWKCKLCRARLAVSKDGGTGSLSNHLKNVHPRKYLEFKADSDKGQMKMHVVLLEPKTPEVEQYNVDSLNQMILRFVICTNQAFAVVDDNSFRELMLYACAGKSEVTLPNQKKVREMIAESYSKERENLKLLLNKNSSKVSFTIDGWSSKNRCAFQGVTCHYINDNWEMKSVALDLTVLEGSHTGLNLSNSFCKLLGEMDLWDKILAVTTDNAANMDKFAVELDQASEEHNASFKSNDYRIRCMAHIINLACKAALKTLDSANEDDDEIEDEDIVDEDEVLRLPIIIKIRKIVKAIRASNVCHETLFKQCKVAGVDSKNVILDVKTRWNSTLDMLQRARELRQPLELTLQSYRNLKSLILSENEWLIIDQIIELLTPFKEATLLMSHESIPKLGDTVLIYNALFDHLEKYINDVSTTYRSKSSSRRDAEQISAYPDWLKDSAQKAWDKLSAYYPSVDGLAYAVATVLDPRFKAQWYVAAGWRHEWITKTKSGIKSLWIKKYRPEPRSESSDEPSCSSRELTGIQSKIFEQLESIGRKSNNQDELARYLSEPIAGPKSFGEGGYKDVLDWWKVHQHAYPYLSQMARDFLAISATGVPSERFFSTGANVVTHKRHSLDNETIRQSMCLRNWFLGFSASEYLHAMKQKALGNYG